MHTETRKPTLICEEIFFSFPSSHFVILASPYHRTQLASVILSANIFKILDWMNFAQRNQFQLFIRWCFIILFCFVFPSNCSSPHRISCSQLPEAKHNTCSTWTVWYWLLGELAVHQDRFRSSSMFSPNLENFLCCSYCVRACVCARVRVFMHVSE